MQAGNPTIADFKQLFDQMLKQDDAGLFASTVGENPPVVYRTIPLDTTQLAGAPLELGLSFRGFFVLQSTDPTVTINVRLGSKDSNIDSFPIRNNSSLKLPFPIQKIYLDWAAQPGKTISILFFTRGEFSTNQLVSSLSAQVTNYTGSSVTQVQKVIAASTATAIFPLDTSRKQGTWRNESGADMWGGDLNVTNTGTTQGFRIPAGTTIQWSNTAALFVFSVAGSTEHVMIET